MTWEPGARGYNCIFNKGIVVCLVNHEILRRHHDVQAKVLE